MTEWLGNFVVDDRVPDDVAYLVSWCPHPTEPGCGHHPLGIHHAVRLDLRQTPDAPSRKADRGSDH